MTLKFFLGIRIESNANSDRIELNPVFLSSNRIELKHRTNRIKSNHFKIRIKSIHSVP